MEKTVEQLQAEIDASNKEIQRLKGLLAAKESKLDFMEATKCAYWDVLEQMIEKMVEAANAG